VTRRLIFAANWKMHHGPAAARSFVEFFVQHVPPRPDRCYWFFTPAVSLAAASSAAAGRDDIQVGAQHVHAEPKGAFTGELSVPLIVDAGATGALVGHSERRHLFGETDAQTGAKVHVLLTAGLHAMLCVGETLDQRERGETDAVVARQLAAGLAAVGARDVARLSIAYEPVWAIGTGRNATPEDAAAVHRMVRAVLHDRKLPEGIPVLYGGSVNPGNVVALAAELTIDGVLVGGASLDPKGWSDLVRLAG
jgi:triosephosphate isomerase